MNIKLQQIQCQSYSDHERYAEVHHIQLQCMFEPSEVADVTTALSGRPAAQPTLIDVKAHLDPRRGDRAYISVDALEHMFRQMIRELRFIERSDRDSLERRPPSIRDITSNVSEWPGPESACIPSRDMYKQYYNGSWDALL